jgi:hypothetical protein
MLHCGYAYFAGFSSAGRANLGIHGKCSRFAIFLTDIWQNIGGLLDFACILAKLYTSLGFRGKVMDLYIVIKMH